LKPSIKSEIWKLGIAGRAIYIRILRKYVIEITSENFWIPRLTDIRQSASREMKRLFSPSPDFSHRGRGVNRCSEDCLDR
jgi:hypothetical protein